jgi:hypothetical protein
VWQALRGDNFTWEVFLLGLKASVQGKLSFTLPFSLLMGKRVSTAVMDL